MLLPAENTLRRALFGKKSPPIGRALAETGEVTEAAVASEQVVGAVPALDRAEEGARLRSHGYQFC